MQQAGDAAANWLHDAQQAIDEACRRLRAPTPQSLEAASEDLTLAAAGLEQLAAAWRQQPPGNAAALRTSLAGLRRQMAQLRLLLEQAGNFQAGWAHLLGTMLGGYTPQGGPAPLSTPPALSLEG